MKEKEGQEGKEAGQPGGGDNTAESFDHRGEKKAKSVCHSEADPTDEVKWQTSDVIPPVGRQGLGDCRAAVHMNVSQQAEDPSGIAIQGVAEDEHGASPHNTGIPCNTWQPHE